MISAFKPEKLIMSMDGQIRLRLDMTWLVPSYFS